MPATSPSLRWLYLAVLGPLVLLALLAWWGTQSQLKAAWTDARSEAKRVVDERASSLALKFREQVTIAPTFPDPPVPGSKSESDATLDSSDIPALIALRDDPESGVTPSGLPRRALAGLRIHHLDPTLQQQSALVELVTKTAPSVITSRLLADLKASNEDLVNWDHIQTVQGIARTYPAEAQEGFWHQQNHHKWWIKSSEGAVSFLSFPAMAVPHPLSDGEADREGLQPWLSLDSTVEGKSVLSKVPPPTGSIPLYEGIVPVLSGIKMTAYADPGILEVPIRRQQKWIACILVASLATAAISLYIIHRTVARERRLADLKSQFVASVSHELRAPLGSIRLMAEALQQEKVSKPAEFHTLIAREGARLSHLIENVLDFARIEEGRKHYKYEDCDLTALLRDTLRLMQPIARDRSVHLTFDLPDLTATIDPAAIQQALVNLLDNAIKFTPPQSSVDLQISTLPDQAIQITIADHGPGIPKSEHRNIFKRFHRLGNELRRETQGTGIGLSIVKHIVEAHDGSISVSSTPPDGATFTLILPEKPCES